jgi:hypothetical protein
MPLRDAIGMTMLRVESEESRADNQAEKRGVRMWSFGARPMRRGAGGGGEGRNILGDGRTSQAGR